MTTAQKIIRVLHIDDDPVQLKLVALTLDDGSRFEVVGAPCIAAGVALLEASPAFDVVLLDLFFPELGGAAVLERIRAATKAPVILFSGYRAGLKACETQADATIEKASLSIDDFISKIVEVANGG